MSATLPSHYAHILSAAEAFVQKELKGNDGSHDYSHIERVRKTARSLALEEELSPHSIFLCELAALLHDVRTHAYEGEQDAYI